ncbi:unnamed protein product [Parascedosporium putredinis]|uniref:Xanthine phosphoribosyltransferase 1 n=1 Tax=Parascedosporium putredinis TaxID=1442378 RepID=A0A9P1GZV8_9PEZI|nr:unnamed protein product [Parascedosporium putredinis]CAI7992215.1 unnamed protein product [Parascedosporium putredinis]
MVEKLYVTYNDVHRLCQESAPHILEQIQPQLMIAIGGGGFIPARHRPLPLREPPSLGPDNVVEVPGTKVTRTQWLDLSALGQMENLVGKNILIVDEVDDTRTTLDYAVKELEKDVEAARQRMGPDAPQTKFSIFVLHNKDKPKKGTLPTDMQAEGRYVAARTVKDVWICYPWEAIDIEDHDRLAAEALAAKNSP